MWKKCFLAVWSCASITRGQECCGADCQVDSDQPAPGCNTQQTIHHGGFHVTAAHTMAMDAIHSGGYQEMFNASCASGFQNHRSNLSVGTLVYDCGGLCPERDYGDIFIACCGACQEQDDSMILGNEHISFTHCKGCPRCGDGSHPTTDTAGAPHCTSNTPALVEDEDAFKQRINITLHAQIDFWVDHLNRFTLFTDHVYGSDDHGAWRTNVSQMGQPDYHADNLESGNAIPTARPILSSDLAPMDLPLAAGAATQGRRLPAQPMFSNSYGYNTRCAAAIPGRCHGTFQISLIDCHDCADVPILQRACCRDCGCEQAQRSLDLGASAVGDHIHLECAGCSCDGANTGIEAWVAHYVGNCDPLQAEISARFYVHGMIPITWESEADQTSILNNPNAPNVIGAAIAQIVAAGVTADDITVRLEDAGRRLSSEVTPAASRRLSGVINAIYDIAAPSEAAAHTAEANIEAETVSSALAVINQHLTPAGMHSASSTGHAVALPQGASLASPVAPPVAPQAVRQSTAVQASPVPAPAPAPPASTSGAWLPAVLGVAVALGLAVFAVVVFLNSGQTPDKKKNKRGLSLSPGPSNKSPRNLQAKAPVVQPTTSTVLPVASLMQPPVLMNQPMYSASAVRVPQQPLMYQR